MFEADPSPDPPAEAQAFALHRGWLALPWFRGEAPDPAQLAWAPVLGAAPAQLAPLPRQPARRPAWLALLPGGPPVPRPVYGLRVYRGEEPAPGAACALLWDGGAVGGLRPPTTPAPPAH